MDDHDRADNPDHANQAEENLPAGVATLLGESLPYLRDSLLGMPECRRENVSRICRIALRRLGEDAIAKGSLPPAVVGRLVNEGSYCPGGVSAEYWGGIIACSRGENPRDDRAARRLMAVARMGEYAVRSHYHFYSALRLLILNTRNPDSIDFDTNRVSLATFIPAGYYILAMDYNRDEIARMPRIVSDVLYTLGQEFLLDGSNTGTDHYLRTQFSKNTTGAIRGEGIVFAPSVLGLQMFLWAFGRRDLETRAFLDPDYDCRIQGVQMGVDEAGLVYKK